MTSGKRIALGTIVGLALLCAIAPAFADDGQVIGQTTVFHITPSAFLVATDETDATQVAGVQAFNYFFSLEVFVALLAVWVRMFISVFKREVL